MKTSEFISKLNDPALAQKMSGAKSPEEVYAVAKASGVTDSLEDFMAEIGKLKSSDGELSEDNLASVAGGGFCDRQAYIATQNSRGLKGIVLN